MNTSEVSPLAKPTTEKDEILFACKITKTGTQVGDVILAAGHVVRLPKAKVDALVSIGAAEVIGV